MSRQPNDFDQDVQQFLGEKNNAEITEKSAIEDQEQDRNNWWDEDYPTFI